LNPSDLYAFGRAQISNKAALSQKTEIRLAGAVIQVAGISWNDVQTFTVSAKSIGASVPEPSFKDPTASAEATYLKQRNQQLAEEVTKLRSLLNERNKETKELRTLLARLSAKPQAQIDPGSEVIRENRRSAAEMLADLDQTEAEALFEILGNEAQAIKDISDTLGLEGAVRLVSLLAKCGAANVDGELVVRTEFGRRLWEWIMSETELPTAP